MRDGTVIIKIPPAVCTSNFYLWRTVFAIGAASHALLYLDSVVDNLLPAAMPFLRTIYATDKQADNAWEWLVSSRMYGLAAGCLASLFITQQQGRKRPIVFGTVLDIVGVVLSFLTVFLPFGVAPAVVGRFINGIGHGIVQTAGSVMLAELPPTRKRGTALATLTVWAAIGELLGMTLSIEEIFGNPHKWHYAMGFPLAFLIPSLYFLIQSPESPRYLFMNDREEDARKSLSYYQSSADAKSSIEEIFQEMKLMTSDVNSNSRKPAASTSEEPHPLRHLLDRLGDGHFARPLCVALFVQCFVHLDDWLWLSYSTQIFANAGFATNRAQWSSLLMVVPQAGLGIGLLACFDQFPRRTLLLLPSLASAFVGIVVIVVITNPGVIGTLPLPSALTVLASFDLSAAVISGESAFAIVPELFLQNDKMLGAAIVGIAQNVFGGLLTTFLLTALNQLGTWKVMIPFVLMNFLYVAVNYVILPETAERTPQDILKDFSREPLRPLQWLSKKARRLGELPSQKNLIELTGFLAQVAVFFFIIQTSWQLLIVVVEKLYF